MDCIIFAMPDHSVVVCHPAERCRREKEDRAAWLQRVLDKARPEDAIGAYLLDRSSLPDDHRDAWVWDGSKVVVDPSRIQRKVERQVQRAVDAPASATFDPSPFLEQIEHLKKQNLDLADRLTQLIDYVTHVRLIEANKTLAINATKSDAEVPTAEQQKIREAARHYLSISAQKRGMGFDEFVAVAKREADEDLVRLVTG